MHRVTSEDNANYFVTNTVLWKKNNKKIQIQKLNFQNSILFTQYVMSPSVIWIAMENTM